MNGGSLALKPSDCKQALTDSQAFWHTHTHTHISSVGADASAVRHTPQDQVTAFSAPLQHNTNIQRIPDYPRGLFDPGDREKVLK